MFIWTKRKGEPSSRRFLWWPLLVSIVVLVLLNVLLNAVL